jgi:uncharacterized protein YjbI with pentapeptide repeats
MVGVNFEGATLQGASFEGSNCEQSILNDANLREAELRFACFADAQLRNADLSDADLTGGFFERADLEGARLDGIKLCNTGTEGWIIKGVRCTHFFVPNRGQYLACECGHQIEAHRTIDMLTSPEDEEDPLNWVDPMWRRVPETGSLKPGEFEDRFRSRPTIEFMFEKGMSALEPAVLGLAIDQGNLKDPAAGLRLLDITARGGLPRAIIEIAEKVSKPDALALVTACYEEKFRQMQREIRGLEKDKDSLLQASSKKMLLSPLEVDDELIRVSEGAKMLAVNPGTLSRWATEGKIEGNRKKGTARRLRKSSVLLMKHRLENEDRRKDAIDVIRDRGKSEEEILRQMGKGIPDKH